MRLESEPSITAGGLAHHIALRRLRHPHLDAGFHARRRQLLGGLFGVAPVGDEDERVVPHEDHARATGEAGEVGDVRQAGDEQRVDARRLEATAQPLGAPRDVHRGQLRQRGRHPASFNNAHAASSARRYPSRPKPATVPVTTGATTDVRRHASRAGGFERWSSTFGPSNAARASAIA